MIGTIEGGHLLGRRGGYHAPLIVRTFDIENGQAILKEFPPSDPKAQLRLRQYLRALYRFLQQEGLTNHYIQHVHDEPHGQEISFYRQYALLVREELPGIPIIDAVSFRQNISFYQDVADIWVPVLGSFDHQLDLIQKRVQQGGSVWFYTCIVPQGRYLNRFIDYPLLKTRLLHWLNFRHRLSGFLHWGGNYWGPKPFLNTQLVINQNRTLLPAGDNAIIYPNRNDLTAYPSIRLKAMQAGIQDYELLRMLEDRKPEIARQLARQAIPHMNDYVRDVRTFNRLYRQLLKELEQ